MTRRSKTIDQIAVLHEMAQDLKISAGFTPAMFGKVILPVLSAQHLFLFCFDRGSCKVVQSSDVMRLNCVCDVH